MFCFAVLLASKWLQWLVHLGAPGAVALGILDASVVPLPGSLDFLTIILSAHKHELWWLYAIAAWIGSVGGAWITYGIGEQGGKQLLETKIPKKSLQRVSRWMEEHSSLTLFIPTLLPPPTPVSYFVLAAGVMGISRRKFLLTFGGAKAIRYTLLAYFSSRYGHQIIHWTRANYPIVLYILLGMLLIGIFMFGGWAFYRRQKGKAVPTERERAPKTA